MHSNFKYDKRKLHIKLDPQSRNQHTLTWYQWLIAMPREFQYGSIRSGWTLKSEFNALDVISNLTGLPLFNFFWISSGSSIVL